VAVVGAGPAGITAATTAAARGHAVTLFETQARAGGWLRAGSVPVIKFDVANYLAHLEHRLERAERDGLEFRRASEATAEGLRAEGFDTILCCTGSAPAAPVVANPAGLKVAAWWRMRGGWWWWVAATWAARRRTCWPSSWAGR
jgi:2,4-dienoyl-CoA reductase (NADPH2)